MNVLFVGRFYPEELVKTVNQDCRGRIVFSNHNFEQSLLEGFLGHPEHVYRVVTLPNVGSFPLKNKHLRTRRERYSMGGIPVESVGFCNLWPVFTLSGMFHLAHVLARHLQAFPEGKVHVLVNAPTIYMQRALQMARSRVRREVSVTMLLPDVPSVLSEMASRHGIRHRMEQIQNQRFFSLAARYDAYVFLAEAMKEFFPAGKPSIVMEGMAQDAPQLSAITAEPRKRIIAYTGSLHFLFGIRNLLDAFDLLDDPAAELWLAGSGDAESFIGERASRDARIHYFGLVDPQEARRIQQKAAVLVNPRTSEGRFTRYSFPSKTLEYLLTGRPVLMNRLPGIPDDYLPYILIPEDESVATLAALMRRTLAMSEEERNAFGARGRQFVLEQKNPSAQTGRILAMMAHET